MCVVAAAFRVVVDSHGAQRRGWVSRRYTSVKSRADVTSASGADEAADAEESVFESQPIQSKANATPTTEAENTGADGPSIVEGTPQRSSAAATAADNVLTEQSDVSVRKSRSLMQIKFRECKVTEAIPSAPQMVKSPDVDMKG